MNLKKLSYLAITTLALALPIRAQMDDMEDEMQGGKPEQGAKAEAQYKADLEKYKDNPNFLVLPGLVADRKEQTVDVICETTTLAARSSSEYLIVSQHSSHGYEAMLWSFAMPSDLHAALEFIGMRAGAPRDYSQLRFWSKGDRVNAFVVIHDDEIPIEHLILNSDTGETLPEEGWVFTGSMTIDNPTGGTERVYLADEYDPRSIIAAYNEPASILDPPWQASKGEFYDTHVASPEFAVKAHELVTVRFEPQLKDGQSRMRDLTLEVSKDMDFTLKDAKTGKVMGDQRTFECALAECKKIIAEQKEPYLTMKFDDSLQLAHIQRIATVLMLLDGPQGIRIEPPSKQRLYYKAFLPNQSWLEPEDRMEQPWEVHIQTNGGKLSASMVMYDTHWKQGQSRPDLTKRSYDVKTGEEIRKRLEMEFKERKDASRRPPPSVLLIFVKPDVTYGTLLNFIGPAIEAYSTVHLFLEEEPEPEKNEQQPVVTEQ